MASVFEIIFKSTGLESLSNSLRGKLTQLASIGAAWKVASAAFQDYLSKQDALADLDSGLQRAGQLTQEYREKLIQLADDMERTAGIADDKMLSALGRLSREGMDPAQADQMASALKNLAALMGGDVNQAAVMLGKAMHGNFDTFGRMGIAAKDLDTLFRELAARGGGLLEARMQTLRGQIQNVNNAFGDLGEAAVKAFVDASAAGSGVDPVRYLERFAIGIRQGAENLGILGEALRNVFEGKNWSDGAGLDNARAQLASVEERARRMGQTVKDAGRIMADAFDPFLDTLDRMAAQQQEIIDSNADMAEALINKGEAEGTIQPEEAARQRDQIRIQAERDKLRNESEAAAIARAQAERVIASPQATPEQRDAAIKARERAEDTLNRAAPRARSIEAKDINSRASFDQAVERRDIRLNEEADQARRKKDDLAAKAEKMADAAPMVTEADAISAIEAAINRTLTNQQIRFKKMTGELERVRKQIEAGRA